VHPEVLRWVHKLQSGQAPAAQSLRTQMSALISMCGFSSHQKSAAAFIAATLAVQDPIYKDHVVQIVQAAMVLRILRLAGPQGQNIKRTKSNGPGAWGLSEDVFSVRKPAAVLISAALVCSGREQHGLPPIAGDALGSATW
jgi:hypothetical protein